MRNLHFAAALMFALPLAARAAPPEGASAAKPAAAVRTIELAVTEKGFEPDSVPVKKGEKVKLVVTRKTDATCATELLIDGSKIKLELPLDKAVSVEWTAEKAGKVKFGCAMNKMVGGVLVVE